MSNSIAGIHRQKRKAGKLEIFHALQAYIVYIALLASINTRDITCANKKLTKETNTQKT